MNRELDLIRISINTQPIERVTGVRFLGITLDPSLSGKAHFEYLIKKGRGLINILSSLAAVWALNLNSYSPYTGRYSEDPLNMAVKFLFYLIKRHFCYKLKGFNTEQLELLWAIDSLPLSTLFYTKLKKFRLNSILPLCLRDLFSRLFLTRMAWSYAASHLWRRLLARLKRDRKRSGHLRPSSTIIYSQ